MKYIIYYRVSTKRQGIHGLGMDAQTKMVQDYINANPGQILGEYREVESGRKKNRPELKKALAHAKLGHATLIIAKLDRLARNVAFIANLRESGVEFICCDQPHATKFTIHILAAVAEQEVDMIRERTKAALAAYKARGGLLGAKHPNYKPISLEVRARAQKLGSEANKTAAITTYQDVLPMMAAARRAGDSYAKIASHLNRMSWPTRCGKTWTATQVMRVLKRAESLP